MVNAWPLTRRAVLATMGTAVLAEAASEVTLHLRDGGFEIRAASAPVWTVTREVLASALGPDVRLELESPLAVACHGRLIGRPVVLRIVVSQSGAAWRIGGSLAFAEALRLAFDPDPLPTPERPASFSATLDARTARFLAAHFPVEIPLAGRVILGPDLIPVLRSAEPARPWPALPRVAAWRLLPGTRMRGGFALLARAALPSETPVALPLGSHAGLAPSLIGQCEALHLVRSEEMPAGLLADGRFALSVLGELTLQAERVTDGAAHAAFGVSPRGRTLIRIALPVRVGPQAVETRAGTFILEDAADAPPAIRVRAEAGQIGSFEVSARLTHYDLRLPAEAQQAEARYADLGRLDFTGGRLAFRLGTLPTPATAGTLRLGPGPGQPLELSLDDARLTVRRERDLLSLVFGFRNVTLRAGAGRPALQLPKGGDAPTDLPLLRVEFPPQHVLEHAYARRRPTLAEPPGLDDVLADSDETQGIGQARLALARDPARRKDVLEQLLKPLGKDHAFRLFVTAYGTELKNLAKRRKLHLGDNHPDQFWLGPDFALTTLARQAARQAAAAGTPEPGPLLATIPLGLGPVIVADLLLLHDPSEQKGAQDLLQALLREAERRDPDHAIIQAAWRTSNTRGDRSRFHSMEWKRSWPSEFADPGIRDKLTAMWRWIAALPASESERIQEALHDAYREPFPWTDPVEARASGITHLVFDWTSRPAPLARLDAEPQRPYALSELLAWRDLSLRVSRRAERFEPLSSAELAERLKTFHIDPDVPPATRLRQVVAAATAPDEVPCTRIALPARLHLSPASDTRFHPAADPAATGPAVLWRAEMREVPGKRHTLHALGSPDFRKEVFESGKNGPDRGPGVSWLRPGARFRAALDTYDRHQIVGLSGLHGLPVVPRRGGHGNLHSSQVAPPSSKDPPFSYKLTGLSVEDAKDQAIYLPEALPTRLMTLSAMGASLDLDARFTPPAALRDENLDNLFEAFSVERWRSRIVLGREVVTEVLYKGFLYPLGHRATLVKVTERRFESPDLRDAPVPGGPVAYLTQRLFIQVASPTKTYAAVGQPFSGRGWPARSVEIVTTQTPDLVEPFMPRRTDGHEEYREHLRGTLLRRDATGLVFWPRTRLGQEGDVLFRMRLDGAPDVVSMPLLFVDNAAAHEPREMRRLAEYYNTLWQPGAGKEARADSTPSRADPRRRLGHRGAARRYAVERRSGDTVFETREWVLRADNLAERPESHDPEPEVPADRSPEDRFGRADFLMSSTLESDDQPPFYPRLVEAAIRQGPAARLSGRAGEELLVTYLPHYLRDGGTVPDEARARTVIGSDAFLKVLHPSSAALAFGGAGDRVGALGRPEQQMQALARIGPLGELPTTSDSGFSARFFPEPKRIEDLVPGDPQAKLLGLVDFRKLLKNTIGNAKAPLLQEVTHFACEHVEAVLSPLKERLQDLKRRMDAQPAIALVYAEAKAALDAAVRDVEVVVGPGAACDTSEGASRVAAAAASLRRLSAELERLAAAPLAPLAEFGRRKLEEQRRALQATVSGLETSLPSIPQVAAAIRAARAWVQPVDAAWLIAASGQGNQGQTLRAEVEAALRTAFARVAARDLPPDFAAFRAAAVAESAAELRRRAEAARDGAAASLEALADHLPALVGALPLPPAFASLYALAHALTRADLKAVVDALTAEAVAVLTRWTDAQAQGFCAEAEAAFAEIRALLRPGDLAVILPCASPREACPAPAGSTWCARLWILACDLDPLGTGLRPAGDRLVTTLVELDASTLALPDPGACDPAGLAAAWQRVAHAWDAAGTALVAWLKALEAATRNRAAEVAERARTLARELIAELAVPLATADPLAALRPLLARLLGKAAADAAIPPLDGAVARLRGALRALADRGNEAQKALADAEAALRDLPARLAEVARLLVAQLVLMPLAPVAKAAVEEAAERIRQALKKAHDTVLSARGQAALALADVDSKLQATSAATSFACAVRVPPPPPDGHCAPGTADALTEENAGLADPTRPGALPATDRVRRFLERWRDNRTAVQSLLDSVASNLANTAAAQLVRLLDLEDLRRKVEDALAELIPSRIVRTYDHKLPMSVVELPGGITFRPVEENAPLTLSSTAEANAADVIRPGTSPEAKLTVKAVLPRFEIDIQGYLTLRFNPFTFTAGTGRSPKLDAPFDRIVLQEKLIFLAGLAAYLGYKNGGAAKEKPNGPYVEPRARGAGLRAGFRLTVPSFSVGTVGFANVAFDGHCELPFNGEEGVVRLSLSSRRVPFLVSCAPYGGAGFVLIESTAEGVRRTDVSMEFGGAAVVSYGPLEGVGRVMTGLYVTQAAGSKPLLYGTFSAAFVGSVAGFGVASAFYLRMTYDGNQMAGDATLSYSFSLGITDITINVTVWRSEGKSLGAAPERRPAEREAPPSANAARLPDDNGGQGPRIMLAQIAAPPPSPPPAPRGLGVTQVASPLQDWDRNRALFDTTLRPARRRSRP